MKAAWETSESTPVHCKGDDRAVVIPDGISETAKTVSLHRAGDTKAMGPNTLQDETRHEN